LLGLHAAKAVEKAKPFGQEGTAQAAQRTIGKTLSCDGNDLHFHFK
jgi:hypothetical protein